MNFSFEHTYHYGMSLKGDDYGTVECDNYIGSVSAAIRITEVQEGPYRQSNSGDRWDTFGWQEITDEK